VTAAAPQAAEQPPSEATVDDGLSWLALAAFVALEIVWIGGLVYGLWAVLT
jgi:hypothetical protein